MILLLLMGVSRPAEQDLVGTLYAQSDWAELALEARRLEVEGDPAARLLLAAAYSRTDRWERAHALLSEQKDTDASLLRAWMWRDRDPWTADALLTRIDPMALTPSQSRWHFEERVRLNLETGRPLEAKQLLVDRGLSQLAERVSTRGRSPALGGALSAVVPGLGQAIAGDAVGAVSALTVNAGLGAGLAYAISEQQWGSAGLLGVFALGFYGGNIYGGADAAIRFNRHLRDQSLAALAQSPDWSAPRPPPLAALETASCPECDEAPVDPPPPHSGPEHTADR